MKGIVIVDENWNIGLKGKLLAHLPGDLKFFKETTEGKVIVYGRKTLESFPGSNPLPNRTNIILTRNPQYKNKKAIVCCGEEALWHELKRYPEEDVFIAGGSSVYEKFLDYCGEILVTKMYKGFEADSRFPNLDERTDFRLKYEGPLLEEKGIKFRFTTYEKK